MTAYRRIDAVRHTLAILHQCDPGPEEIIVHVDGGEHTCAATIEREFPGVRVIISEGLLGPGGGRNKLMAAATHPIVASFDDDSYPVDRDFFARVTALFERHPEAWVLDSHVFHPQQAIEPESAAAVWVADFSGGGCAYRKARFLAVGGYVPLPTAYGMEEVDFGLRLHALGGRVLRSRRLRVFHNTDLARHADPAVTAATIVNIALLAYLRYPRWFWGLGAAQCVKRIGWLVRHRRFRGVVSGLIGIPAAITRHRGERDPISAPALRSYFSLRRHPVPVGYDSHSVPARHG
ncbi:MAG: glycosyltransferase family A protein [Vicinamibacterales bacterium]